MMGFFMLRRARLRSLKEGQVQTVRGEATENDVKDAIERFQDYGFAGNPVDGQGLVLHIDGHTIVIRKDRLAERPRLGAYEVCVWHKEGHKVTLKDGKLIEVECDDFVLKATNSVKIETKTMTVQASTKARVESPLTENTGTLQTQNLTIGLTGPGTATMEGGTINYIGVNLNYQSCNSAYLLGTFTYNSKDMTDTHFHTNSGGSGNGGPVG